MLKHMKKAKIMVDKETQTIQDKVYSRRHNMLQEFSIPISSLKSKRVTTFWTQCNLLFIRSLEADVLKAPTTVARMCMGIMVGIFIVWDVKGSDWRGSRMLENFCKSFLRQ